MSKKTRGWDILAGWDRSSQIRSATEENDDRLGRERRSDFLPTARGGEWGCGDAREWEKKTQEREMGSWPMLDSRIDIFDGVVALSGLKK